MRAASSRPVPSTSSVPRCRQRLWNARSAPASSRNTHQRMIAGRDRCVVSWFGQVACQAGPGPCSSEQVPALALEPLRADIRLAGQSLNRRGGHRVPGAARGLAGGRSSCSPVVLAWRYLWGLRATPNCSWNSMYRIHKAENGPQSGDGPEQHGAVRPRYALYQKRIAIADIHYAPVKEQQTPRPVPSEQRHGHCRQQRHDRAWFRPKCAGNPPVRVPKRHHSTPDTPDMKVRQASAAACRGATWPSRTAIQDV